MTSSPEKLNGLIIAKIARVRPSNDGSHVIFGAATAHGEEIDLAVSQGQIVGLIYCASVGVARCEAKTGGARLALATSNFSIRVDEGIGEFILSAELLEHDGQNHPTILFSVTPELANHLTEIMITRPIITSKAAHESNVEALRAKQKSRMVTTARPAYPARHIFTDRLNHHLHDPLNRILIISSSLRISGDAILREMNPESLTKDKISQENQVAFFESKLFDASIVVPDFGPVQTALRNQYPDKIEMEVRPGRPDEQQFAVKTDKYADAMFGLFSGIFVQFYEDYAQWLLHNVASDVSKWPIPWSFAKVVRNSTVHSGKIYYKGRKREKIPTVIWHHLSYGPDDEGRIVFGGDFTLADILLLLMEMSDALKSVRCPVIF